MDVKDGILIECVSCKVRRLLTYEEAADYEGDQPTCNECYMPCIPIAAGVSNTEFADEEE